MSRPGRFFMASISCGSSSWRRWEFAAGSWLIDWIRDRDIRRGDHMPVIAITAGDDLYDFATAHRHGLDAYLRKPVPFRTLCSTVARVVESPSDEGRSAARA